MPSLPILYSFRRCPYAIRARLALLASGQSVELREVKLAAKPAAMLAVSSKATVPVLVLPDGLVIDQSIDIMRWALARNDPEHWLIGDDADLIAMNDGPFKYHLDRFKYPNRHGADPDEHRAEGVALLKRLETRLAIAGQLCGSRRTLVDMALFPFVRQFAGVDPNRFAALSLPFVQRWLDGHVESTLFAAAMIRPFPWREEDEPLCFG